MEVYSGLVFFIKRLQSQKFYLFALTSYEIVRLYRNRKVCLTIVAKVGSERLSIRAINKRQAAKKYGDRYSLRHDGENEIRGAIYVRVYVLRSLTVQIRAGRIFVRIMQINDP